MSVPAGCCANRSRIALTIDVTGWCSAKARTGPRMVSVATNAELMNRLPGASGLRCGPHPSMIDSH